MVAVVVYDVDWFLTLLKLQFVVLFCFLAAGAHFFYLGASIFSRCMREPRYERRRNEPPPQRHQSEPHQKVEKTEAGEEEPKEKKGWFGRGGNKIAEESDNERVYVEDDSEQEEADAGMEAAQSGGSIPRM